jgi:hypothetical protein
MNLGIYLHTQRVELNLLSSIPVSHFCAASRKSVYVEQSGMHITGIIRPEFGHIALIPYSQFVKQRPYPKEVSESMYTPFNNFSMTQRIYTVSSNSIEACTSAD